LFSRDHDPFRVTGEHLEVVTQNSRVQPDDDASDPDRDDPGTRSRVTRVDASTRVDEHDQNVDTLLVI
jgi:hypothetical protein